MTLLGLPLADAERALRERGLEYRVTRYQSKRPYTEADSERVVRANEVDGVYELVGCGFITTVKTELE